MSYFYQPYNSSAYENELSLWDIIEALQNQAAQQEQPQPPRRQNSRAGSQKQPANAGRYSSGREQQRRPYASVVGDSNPSPIPDLSSYGLPASLVAALSSAAPQSSSSDTNAGKPSGASASAATSGSSARTSAKPAEKSISPFVVQRAPRTDVFVPSLDVYDTKQNYKVYAAIPGARKSSIEVHFNPDTNELTLEGEVPPPTGIKLDSNGQPTSETYQDLQLVLTERESGAFARTLHFPADPKVEDEGITAKYNGGVLEITVPKKSGTTQTRRKIQVEDVDDEELIAEAQQDVE